MKEIIEQSDDKIDYVVTPVGGGGLISGTALTASYLSPDTKIIGAEPSTKGDAYLSMKNDEYTPNNAPATICDGLKVPLGKLPFKIMREHVH